MREYVYEICLYDSNECNEIWHGYFSVPDIVAIFSEEDLDDAKSIVENNISDLHEGVFDFAVIEKVPLGTLYYNMFVEERWIYKYDGNNHFKLVGTLKGKESVYNDTESIVNKALGNCHEQSNRDL